MNGKNFPAGTRKAIVNSVAVHFIHSDFKGQVIDLGLISWKAYGCDDYLRIYKSAETTSGIQAEYINSLSYAQWNRLVREIQAEARLRTPAIFPVY